MEVLEGSAEPEASSHTRELRGVFCLFVCLSRGLEVEVCGLSVFVFFNKSDLPGAGEHRSKRAAARDSFVCLVFCVLFIPSTVCKSPSLMSCQTSLRGGEPVLGSRASYSPSAAGRGGLRLVRGGLGGRPAASRLPWGACTSLREERGKRVRDVQAAGGRNWGLRIYQRGSTKILTWIWAGTV